MIILNSSETLGKLPCHGKLNMAYLPSLKNQQNCWCHHLGYSLPPALHCTIWCQSTFRPPGPGLSNFTSFLSPVLPILRYDNFKLRNPAKLLSSSLPSWVLRAPSTPLYHLVPKHLRATWPWPEQSHLPKACSPNGTDNRGQRQRWTKRPLPEPSDILKRFYALYDDKLRYYMSNVSKLYYILA